MPPTKRMGRFAGMLYLVVALTGPFVLLYVPGKLFVPGDASATVRNILAHQSLFQAHIVVWLVSELFFIGTVLALYRLLKGVSAELAAVMVILVLVDAPLSLVRIANEVATLAFVRSPEFLAAFGTPQRDVVAALLVTVDGKGILVSEVFWGLWLLPLGLLVFRSGFIPRLLGVWLFVNGLSYVAISAIGLFLPEHAKVVSTAATPILLGEVAFMLWLLIVGVRGPTAAAG